MRGVETDTVSIHACEGNRGVQIAIHSLRCVEGASYPRTLALAPCLRGKRLKKTRSERILCANLMGSPENHPEYLHASRKATTVALMVYQYEVQKIQVKVTYQRAMCCQKDPRLIIDKPLVWTRYRNNYVASKCAACVLKDLMASP